MKFLETVIREDAGVGFVCNCKNEGVSTAHGTCRRCNELIVRDCGFKLSALFLGNAMTKGGVNDDRDLGSLELIHERLNSFI